MLSTILAIDPGYDRCGWAIMDQKAKLIEFGCITTEKSQSFFERLSVVLKELSTKITQYKCAELAIETLFFSKNVKTAMRVAEVRGAITGLCLTNNMSIFEYSPVAIKQAATGNGKADKKAVEKMVRLQLKLANSEKILDDALDALAIGITHVYSGKTNKYRKTL